MELTIIDRIKLINLLPKEGTFTDLIHIDGIAKNIEITSDEAQEIDLKTNVDEQGNATISWNLEKQSDKTVKFNKSQIETLKKIFEKIKESDQIVDINLINLYKKLQFLF